MEKLLYNQLYIGTAIIIISILILYGFIFMDYVESRAVFKRGIMAIYTMTVACILINIPIIENKIKNIDTENTDIAIIFIFFAVLVPILLLYKYSIENIMNKILDILFYISIFRTSISILNLNITNIDKLNYFLFILDVYLIFLVLINREKKNEINKKENENSDCEIKEEKQLFDTRKKQLNYTFKYLEKLEIEESFAIALNSEWGKGKTSFVNVLKKKMSEENYYIHINVMRLDTKEKMLEEFYIQLKKIFDDNKIYTGIGSNINHYFEFTKKLLSDDKIIESLNKFFVNYDVTKDKEEVEKNIDIIRNKFKKKIYIIVDDIDRTDKETIKSAIFFIKEIVNFKKCTTIFLMDYKYMKENDYEAEYLGKFINKTIDLVEVGYEEIVKYYIDNNIFLDDFYMNTVNVNEIDSFEKIFLEDIYRLRRGFTSLLNDYISKINRKEKQEFINKLNNPRNVKKILREVEDNYRAVFNVNIINNLTKELCFEIELNNIIMSFSIIKILFREDLNNIKKIGIKQYLDQNLDQSSANRICNQLLSISVEKNNNQDIVKDIKSKVVDGLLKYNSLDIDIRTKHEKIIGKLDGKFEWNDFDEMFENIKDCLTIIEREDENSKKRGGRLLQFICENKKNDLEKMLEILALEGLDCNILANNQFYLDEIIKISNDKNRISYNNKKNIRLIEHKMENILYNNNYLIGDLIILYTKIYSKKIVAINFGSLGSVSEYNFALVNASKENIDLSLVEGNGCEKFDENIRNIIAEIEKWLLNNKEEIYISRQFELLKEKIELVIAVLKKLENLKENIKKSSLNKIYLEERSQEIINKCKKNIEELRFYMKIIKDNIGNLSQIKNEEKTELVRICLSLIIAIREKDDNYINENKELIMELYSIYIKLDKNVTQYIIGYRRDYDRWVDAGADLELIINKIKEKEFA